MMNRRERRYGRMHLLPLLLALTGMSLLVLEWVLRIDGFGDFGELNQVLLHCSFSLLFPVVLMFLYVFRISPKLARIFTIVSVVLLLIQLFFVIYCATHQAVGLIAWIPGHMLLRSIKQLQMVKNAGNILLVLSDSCFVLSSLSAVFTTLLYSYVKTRSDERNAEFDRKNAYLTHNRSKATSTTPTTNEPTRVVPIPEEYYDSKD